MDRKINIGIIGCGKVSAAYFNGCRQFKALNIVACADLDPARARAAAAQFGIARACTVEELLADPQIQIVVNLTVPASHAAINLAAIAAGKSVHCEKPLATDLEDARRTLEAARAAGVRLGCAPDTFLGGGIQTCIKLIREGAIGEPVAAVAFMAGHGMEHWHPDPEFFYQPGAGPMLDLGPYSLTALVNLLGPIKRVAGSARISFPERLITSEPRRGSTIKVNTPTHLSGVVDFHNGAIGTIITSFDVWGHHLPRIEIYGSEGSLSVPDPNTFRGPVRLLPARHKEWQEIPLTHSDQVGRGIGVADMAGALLSGRPHRASGELAYHVLEVMTAFEQSSRANRHIMIASVCPLPAPLPVGLSPGELDL
jgi:predicted dehydrogenase